MIRKNESGQALVLVLLSLAVVLTIVLFILSRSITDVGVSSGQAESVRAFSAAEAGIEKALIIGSAGAGTTEIGDASYTSSVTDFAEGSSEFVYPSPLVSGDTMTTWFVSHDSDGNMICNSTNPCYTGNTLRVCWGNSGTSSSLSTTPAIEVTIYYEETAGDLSTVKVARVTSDPNTTRASSNQFGGTNTGGCTYGTTTYAFKKIISSLTNLGVTQRTSGNSLAGPLFARVRLLYNTDIAHNVGTAVTDGIFPSQGQNIVSTGTAGQSNRRINVFQGFPEFPFGGNSIFSPSGVTK